MKSFRYSNALERLPEQFFAKLVNKVVEVKKHHDDVINLGQGNPDQPTPKAIVERMQVATENPVYHKYPPFKGFPFLKDAVKEYYQKQFDVELDAETEIAILAGTKTGLVEISQCLLNEGDVALVPDPGYPDYWSGLALVGAKMHPMPLIEERDFHPNLEDIPHEIKEQAKLMFLNYPNNPTGAVATKELFNDVISFANTYETCIVHDFAYGAIGYDGQKPLSFMQMPGAKEIGIEMLTMSKTYNMAGWRIGFAVGNRSVIQALELIQDHYYCSLFGGMQEAAAYALTSDQSEVENLVKVYEKRRQVLVEAAHQIGWKAQAPKGSFFAWFPVPKGYTSESFANILLEKARVVVAPGIGFGEHGEGYVRIGLLCDEEQLEEAMQRIGEMNLFS
ncbi:pyridoxal phosphate-dependent aminotransferase [Halalkalibacter hemicellulosilyticus]|uniref:Glutamine-dependent 2-keto-4-methylthiobutyrate transaminase n=1 Tax=Halalkalibacter hemicellulosilyticusJCM 9152 TaxID=1236971 RepID=W4QFB0_9BACI|nr:pyridoxal phosphate-dependent aminotransferase [Halalkalibacter hemicellulosilyticus]GAE30014.1 glutamine-dependent 2-keto-4-methylthiobutyrate transaminase [Halalkalibacter hemicellulosilyticusJCM 9152]